MKSSRLFSWFNRGSYSQKFTVIGLLFIVSLAGFYPMGRDQLERRENYGVKELEGTLYLRPLQTLLADLNTHHILALRAVTDPGAAEKLAVQQALINDDLVELAELDEKYGESLQLDVELVTIQNAWRAVSRAAEKQQMFEINAKHYQINKDIRRAIARIGNTSYLILDPDLDTYYMMDIVLLGMPEFQDLLNQITLIVATAEIQGEISEGKRLELITLSSEFSTYLVQLRSSNKISWANDETGQMRQLTEPALNDLEAKLSAFVNVVNDQIVSPAQVNMTSEHLDSAEAVQTAAITYYEAVSQALEYGINGRIQELTNQVTFAIAFAMAITSIALAIGFILMRTISRPLGELAVAAGRLGAGERGVYVPVIGEDEVGRVGFAFNTMASELETAQKKQETQLNQLTQLTRALETSANVSRRLSTILDPSQLMKAVVTEVQRAFSYYHAHIYLYDQAKEYLVIAGGTGEAGEAMLSSGHKLALGQGLVGKAAVTNAPVLVPDVSKETGWLPNKLLPDTKAEAAVPIALGDQVLGVLDVQHNVIGGLNAESVTLLQSVVNQVAIALQNANLFAERRRANEEMTRFKLALERSTNAVFMTDVKGQIFYVNSGFEEVYGFSAAEAIGQTPRILKSGLIPQEQYAHLWQTLLAKEPTSGEIVNKAKDGRFIPISASNNPIIDETGQLMGFMALHVDMTERIKAENLLAKQTKELSTVALVSTTAATILDPAHLLQEVVDLTKTSFDLYHAHVHLLNDSQDTLVLTAGAGEIGQKMVAEGRRIPLAAKGSLVATTARTRQGSIRNYDPPGEGFMPHPLLAETRCEMALPIALGQEVLGILDVRSDKLNYFGEADMQTYTALAAQIAVALQNARSFTRSEQALKELSALSRRLTREGWESYLDQMGQDLQFAYDLHQVTKGKSENGSAEIAGLALVQPIAVLGESVGQISLMEPRAMADDAAEIMDAVANRLSAHIENLRLTAQTEQALAGTEALYRGSDRVVRATTVAEVMQALTESTLLKQLDQIVLFLFDETWETTPPQMMTAVTTLQQGKLLVSEGGISMQMPLSEFPAVKFLKRDEPFLIPDMRHDDRMDADAVALMAQGRSDICSTVTFPLVVGDDWFGMLTAVHSAPLQMGEEEVRQVKSLTDQAATVIRNLQLIEQTTRRAEEEQILRQITARVSTAVDAESILRTAAGEIGKAFGFNTFVALNDASSNEHKEKRIKQ